MDKILKKEIKRSTRTLVGLLFLGGLVLKPIVKNYLDTFDYKKNEVVNYYDEDKNGKINKLEKKEMLKDLGHEYKKNYEIKKEDFHSLYEGLVK